jgi:anti-sigma regulatory factor (Ser/Thr protein kinase)
MKLPEKYDDTLVLHIPWDLQVIGDLIVRLKTIGQQKGWSPQLLQKTMLVVEELVVNALTYGGQTPERGFLEVRLQVISGGLRIDVYDNGVSFNPFLLSEPDFDADLGSRRVGGLGVFLVKSLSQTHHYERLGMLNHVELRIAVD